MTGSGPMPTVATTPPPGSRYDPLGSLFATMGRSGDDITMVFGSRRHGDWTWQGIAHSATDGFGGLAAVLRAAGATYVRVGDARPRLVGPGPRPRPVAPNSPQVRTAWAVLAPSELAALRAEVRAAGTSLTAHLLAALVFCLPAGRLPPISPWLLPVNLRGSIDLPGGWANQLGFLSLSLERPDSAAIAAQVRAGLAAGRATTPWWATSLLAVCPHDGLRLAVMDRLLPRGYVGLFSNLGRWRADPMADDAWVVGPPVTRYVALGVGVVTVNDTLGLCVRARHDVGDRLSATDLIGAWTSLLRRPAAG